MISSFLFQVYNYCVGHPNKNGFRIGVCLPYTSKLTVLTQ